jgi:hypothetical protein
MQPPDSITAARAPRARGSSLAPGLGLAVLAKFTCAACLDVYAGVLSSLGLGFVATDRGLVGLTALLLVVGTASTAWSARRHGHWGPLVLTVGGALLVIVGRLIVNAPLLYVGTGCIVAASLWNLWLGRRPARELVPLAVSDSVRDRADHTL